MDMESKYFFEKIIGKKKVRKKEGKYIFSFALKFDDTYKIEPPAKN